MKDQIMEMQEQLFVDFIYHEHRENETVREEIIAKAVKSFIGAKARRHCKVYNDSIVVVKKRNNRKNMNKFEGQ